MEVTVPLIARENCIKLPRPYNLVSPGAICAGYKDGGKDACTGDSGGPLLCQLNENSPWVRQYKPMSISKCLNKQVIREKNSYFRMININYKYEKYF